MCRSSGVFASTTAWRGDPTVRNTAQPVPTVKDAMAIDGITALTRFGLGPRLGHTPPTEPRGWLREQLTGADPMASVPGPSVGDGMIALREDRRNPVPAGTPTRGHAIWDAERLRLITGLVTSDAPFRERLVWFWLNHFTISVRRGEITSMAGAYVREAIRPNVTARFVDMLIAVMTHPAMLFYLDNQASVGPGSKVGQQPRPGQAARGLNENLARECLELHTVSPAAGYTQADVTAAARLLTGWSVDFDAAVPGFRFRPGTHEPGAQTVMGRTFPAGQEGGVAMLTWLGTHPATYAHIARKLVVHFAGDPAPPTAIQAVTRALSASGGDLRAASTTLIELPACWSGHLLRTPLDYVAAVARAIDEKPDLQLANAIGALGQPIMSAPLPNGWSNRDEDWDDGEALLRRVDWTWSLAARKPDLDPNDVLDTALGSRADDRLRETVRRAGSRQEALALLLASPAMMRR